MEEKQTEQSNNTNAALTYLVGWLSGLFFLLTEKDDDFIRFNAAQSTALFGALTVISFVPIIGRLLGIILWPVSLVLWVILMIKAYKNERFEIPVIANLAKKLEQSIKA